MKSTYIKVNNSITKDPLWKVNDVDLAIIDGGFSIVSDFIKENYYSDFSLSIFDALTNKTIEIDCAIDNIPKIVSYIYNLEKGTPLIFIGANLITKSYVVGMNISRGRIDFGHYVDKDGKLEKCE